VNVADRTSPGRSGSRAKERGGPEAAPLTTSTGKKSYFFLDFFALHFMLEEAVNCSPL
jgi:hypothetical protein